MSDMARTIDGTVGTQRQAAAALAEVAGTGKLTSEQIHGIASPAVAMEEATGKAIADTVTELKKLADDPAAAAAKLNEQYNFLTASLDEIRETANRASVWHANFVSERIDLAYSHLVYALIRLHGDAQ